LVLVEMVQYLAQKEVVVQIPFFQPLLLLAAGVAVLAARHFVTV
jgi:hypothetical protein